MHPSQTRPLSSYVKTSPPLFPSPGTDTTVRSPAAVTSSEGTTTAQHLPPAVSSLPTRHETLPTPTNQLGFGQLPAAAPVHYPHLNLSAPNRSGALERCFPPRLRMDTPVASLPTRPVPYLPFIIDYLLGQPGPRSPTLMQYPAVHPQPVGMCRPALPQELLELQAVGHVPSQYAVQGLHPMQAVNAVPPLHIAQPWLRQLPQEYAAQGLHRIPAAVGTVLPPHVAQGLHQSPQQYTALGLHQIQSVSTESSQHTAQGPHQSPQQHVAQGHQMPFFSAVPPQHIPSGLCQSPQQYATQGLSQVQAASSVLPLHQSPQQLAAHGLHPMQSVSTVGLPPQHTAQGLHQPQVISSFPPHHAASAYHQTLGVSLLSGQPHTHEPHPSQTVVHHLGGYPARAHQVANMHLASPRPPTQEYPVTPQGKHRKMA